MKGRVVSWSLAMAAGLGLTVSLGPDATAQEDVRNLYLDAKPLLDIRTRYEFVDQEGLGRDAHALTMRARPGLETGRFYGLWAGIDFDLVGAIGRERYNSTINGRTAFPVVADPTSNEINRLFIASDGTIPDTSIKVGRQRIIWDNARFVGNVGFRQNEQTFDAARISTTAVPDTELDYTYIDKVHRIFGDDSPVGSLGMRGHGFRARYGSLDFLTITPFALFLDYDRRSQAAFSSATTGILLDGGTRFAEDWRFLYTAELAHQMDHGKNPADFDLFYYLLEPGLSYRFLTGRLGYEVLQGNGAVALQTPLATLHKFNGPTDRFLVTPPDGLRDLYGAIDFRVPGEGAAAGLSVKAAYHEFFADNGGAHYGREWNLGVFKTLPTDAGEFRFGLRGAGYHADAFGSDATKFWANVQFLLAPRTFREIGGILSDN